VRWNVAAFSRCGMDVSILMHQNVKRVATDY
jgi:hypothetical protein